MGNSSWIQSGYIDSWALSFKHHLCPYRQGQSFADPIVLKQLSWLVAKMLQWLPKAFGICTCFIPSGLWLKLLFRCNHLCQPIGLWDCHCRSSSAMSSKQADSRIPFETSIHPLCLQRSNFQASFKFSLYPQHPLHLAYTKYLVDFQLDQWAPRTHSWTQSKTWPTHPFAPRLLPVLIPQCWPDSQQSFEVAYTQCHHLSWK